MSSHQLRDTQKWNMVLPNLFVGACPENRTDVDQLKEKHGITAILNLQTEADRQLYRLNGNELNDAYRHERIEVCNAPIVDRSEEDLNRCLHAAVRALDELIQQGHVVLVHCNIGNGRSPTVVAAWLCWSQGWPLEEAAEHLQICRQCQPNLNVIRNAGLA